MSSSRSQNSEKWPLITIHGSTHTGAALDSTPGGGEGWLSYAVRNKLATFVVDQPGQGRSGFDQSVILEAKATGNWNLVPSSFGRITDDGLGRPGSATSCRPVLTLLER